MELQYPAHKSFGIQMPTVISDQKLPFNTPLSHLHYLGLHICSNQCFDHNIGTFRQYLSSLQGEQALAGNRGHPGPSTRRMNHPGHRYHLNILY